MTWSLKTSNYKPKRTVSDEELQRCKKIFFDLDRDGSGSIDSDEISFMLRSLGLHPTDEDIKKLIVKFDHSQDGMIQLREFMEMYTNGLDTKHAGREEDFLDTYRAVGSDPLDEKSTVGKDAISEFMLANFELEVDIDQVFDAPAGPSLSYEQFKNLLITETVE